MRVRTVAVVLAFAAGANVGSYDDFSKAMNALNQGNADVAEISAVRSTPA